MQKRFKTTETPVEGSYMSSKIHKLDRQLRADGEKESNLFENLCIHVVNGYMEGCTSEDVRRLVTSHGGDFQMYYMDKVTHIICDQLAESKLKDLRNRRHPPRVVNHHWVTDSVSRAALQPESSYALKGAHVQTPGSIDQFIASRDKNSPHKKGRQHPIDVEAFSSHSRLSFLSRLADEMKQLTAELLRERSVRGTLPTFHGPLGKGSTRVILHVDMDCFFVSVAIRNRSHEEQAMPFAVAHDGANSEISACNYPARAQGVHAMLSVKQARKRCPQLQVEGYHFGDIAAISRKIYEIFCEDAPVVAAISCDEAYLELPEGTDPLAAASHIRKRIYEATKCPVSAGAGSSMMFARIATSEAKPNGQVMLDERAAQILLRELPVRHLPGIGYHRGRKLKFYGFKTCADIQNSTCAKMRSILGDKLGDITFNYACGRDCRPVVTKEGKASVSVSVNYGVDLPDSDAADEFLQDLVQQVVKRLKLIHIDTKTRKVTLQLMKAQEGAGEPLKKKGHGLCDRFSPSMTLSESTQSIGPILAAARTLLAKFDCHPRKIKGLGVVLSELVSSTSGSPIACRRSAHAPVPGELNSAALMKAFIAGGQGSPRLAHVMKTRRHSNSIALGRVLPPQPFHAIRPLLISYLQGISSPSPQHIGFLYEYLASLLDEQRVSEVCACLRTITRIWVGHGNKQADQAAAQLLAKVQETSRALTGCELIVL